MRALAGLGAGALARSIAKAGEAAEEGGRRSRVVLVRHGAMADGEGNVDPRAVREAVRKGIIALADAADEGAAWGRFFAPADRVGVKVNCLGAPGIATRRELAMAVAAGLLLAGVAPANIVVWDRRNDELLRAGYRINFFRRGIRCFGTDTPRVGYEEEATFAGSAVSRLSRILTRLCTAQVNAPVLKDHSIVGMTGAIKNFLGAVDNPSKYHFSHGNPMIADINTAPAIASRVRLVVMDAIYVQYEGGPSFSPEHVERYNAVLLSTDPIAVDTVGQEIVDELRRKHGLPTLAAAQRAPEYLDTAADAEHRLGEREMGKIELVEVSLAR